MEDQIMEDQMMSSTEREEQIISLWNEGFGDNIEFIRDTLSYIPEDLRVLAYADDGTPVGVCVGVPLSVDLWGIKVDVCFIQALYAQPAYRGSKITKNLINSITSFHYSVSALIAMDAHLVRLYERRGVACDHSSSKLVKCSRQEMENTHIGDYIIEPITEGLSDAVTTICGNIPSCLLPHPKMYTIPSSNKDYYAAKSKQGDLLGIVCVDSEEWPHLSMLEAYNDDVRQALIAFIFSKYPVDNLIYTQYSVEPVSGNGYLTRILDATTILSIYAETHPEVTEAYIVTDCNIEKNNRCFVINEGKCIATDTPVANAKRVSIFELTCEILPPLYIPLIFY